MVTLSMLNALGRDAATLGLTLILCFSFTGCGLLILKKTGPTITGTGEKLFLAFAAGTGLAGYLVFLLAWLQLLSPLPLYALLTLLLTAAAAGWRGTGLLSALKACKRPDGPVEQAAFMGTIVLLALALLLALTPEIGKDALVYHLAVPKAYLRHHGFYYIPGNSFANLPFQAEMLYLLGLFLQGDNLAKGLGFAAFPCILLGIRQLSLRMGNNAFPWLSMLIFAALPSMFELSHLAYADLYVALYALAAVFAFLTWFDRNEPSWLFLCALFTGLAASSKYSALLLPFLGVLGVLLRHRTADESKEALRDLARYLIPVVLFSAPFYLKSWFLTGNPVYPFMYSVFDGRGLDPDLARLYNGLYQYMGMGRSWLDFLLLPWNMSVHAQMNSTRFDGLISPLFLIMLPFLAGVRKPGPQLTTIYVYCAANFLFWAVSSQDIRYLSPVLPFLAVLSGVILTRYRHSTGISALLGASVAGCLIFNTSHIARDFGNISPLGVLTGRESREAFLQRNLPVYDMYRFINSDLPDNTRVFLIFMRNSTYLCDRSCYADTMFEDYTLKKILSSSATPDAVYERLKGMGFTHIMYDSLFVTGGKSTLSPEQLALFTAFRDKYLTVQKIQRTWYLYRIQM
jgi:Dolichyl-phosphate-mannose-protein mannosyltransferase